MLAYQMGKRGRPLGWGVQVFSAPFGLVAQALHTSGRAVELEIFLGPAGRVMVTPTWSSGGKITKKDARQIVAMANQIVGTVTHGIEANTKRRASNPEVREMIEKAQAQGWTVEPTGGGHWKFRSPDKTMPLVHVASTPSDHRSLSNAKSLLRRYGLKLNRRRSRR